MKRDNRSETNLASEKHLQLMQEQFVFHNNGTNTNKVY